MGKITRINSRMIIDFRDDLCVIGIGRHGSHCTLYVGPLAFILFKKGWPNEG